jgi:hypothetical protein
MLVPVAEGPAYSSDTKRADAAERPGQEYEIEGAAQEYGTNEASTVVDKIIGLGPIDLPEFAARAEQAVGDRLLERVPGGGDDVLVHAHRRPGVACPVAGLDEHPGDRARAV